MNRFKHTWAYIFFYIIYSSSSFGQCPNVIWADEFTGNSLNTNNWEAQIGTGTSEGLPPGWGNNELQYYRAQNATVANGLLTITAKDQKYRGKDYTSARLRTKSLGDWTYGRFEASIKLPFGQGIWPAFWMLPTDEVYGGWPTSGEIDIMEMVGHEPAKVHGTIHYGDPYPDNQSQGGSFDLSSGLFNDAFHEFAIEWEPGIIRWFVDDILFSTKMTADVSPYAWPFDQDFHLLLNVAVGGNWPGNPDGTTVFPQMMDVDFVRIYDGGKPYISGDRLVPNQSQGKVYSVGNTIAGTTYSWTVPAGSTITSGQGTSSITVDFGNSGGDVVAQITTACGSEQLTIDVTVDPPYIYDFSFINYDDPDNITFNTTTGTYTPDISNPDISGINSSALSAQYIRNSSETFDVLVFDVSSLSNPDEYVNKTRKFYLDVYTSAPAGTLVLIQLEDNAVATPANYPMGRHSRYESFTSVQNQWERLEFNLLDQPDASTATTDKIVFLMASNSNDGSTYYIDNFDSYLVDNGGMNQSPTVDITSPGDGSSFTEGTLVTITANASDPDGSISGVEFFVNGSSIGTDASDPYNVNWTVPSVGSFSLTAEATDNEGAMTLSNPISVTGTPGGNPVSMHVNSITTTTVNAGQGNKRGRAIIEIFDDLGGPVSNANVTGTFSGTFTETVAGVTNGNGIVELTTSGTAKGNLTIDICVDNVTHSTLSYIPADNIITCTGGAGFLSSSNKSKIDFDKQADLTVYPVPFTDKIIVDFNSSSSDQLHLYLHNISGKLLMEKVYNFVKGHNQYVLVPENLVNGVYTLTAKFAGEKKSMIVLKQ